MLSAQKLALSSVFTKVENAIDYMQKRVIRQHILPIYSLSITPDCLLVYRGDTPSPDLDGTPITDACLNQINNLARVNRGWEKATSPQLHSKCINAQFSSMNAGVTVVVEEELERREKRVLAITMGGTSNISNQDVLQYFYSLEMPCQIEIGSGFMQIHMGNPIVCEPLKGDVYRVTAYVRNRLWSSNGRRGKQLGLQAAAHTLRLTCTNGAYLSKSFSRIQGDAWSNFAQVRPSLDMQMQKVLNFQQEILKTAIEQMQNTLPSRHLRK